MWRFEEQMQILCHMEKLEVLFFWFFTCFWLSVLFGLLGECSLECHFWGGDKRGKKQMAGLCLGPGSSYRRWKRTWKWPSVHRQSQCKDDIWNYPPPQPRIQSSPPGWHDIFSRESLYYKTFNLWQLLGGGEDLRYHLSFSMHFFFQKSLPGYTVELNAEGYLRCIGINYLVQDFVDLYMP